MRRHSILLAATALLAVGRANAQPTPPVAPPAPETSKKADPLSPQKAEQEPGPVEQEAQKQASQGGPGAPVAAPADPKKWDVSARHGPGHDATIDTTSGTWMSLDVSPDGREIAFGLLGGLDRDLGSIEPGKLADLVVLDANPLENIRNSASVRYTVANGVVYDSYMDQVAGGARKRRPFWFEQSAGGSYTTGVTVGTPHAD